MASMTVDTIRAEGLARIVEQVRALPEPPFAPGCCDHCTNAGLVSEMKLCGLAGEWNAAHTIAQLARERAAWATAHAEAMMEIERLRGLAPAAKNGSPQ